MNKYPAFKRIRNMWAPRYVSYLKAPYKIKVWVEDKFEKGFEVRIGDNNSTFKWELADWNKTWNISNEEIGVDLFTSDRIQVLFVRIWSRIFKEFNI